MIEIMMHDGYWYDLTRENPTSAVEDLQKSIADVGRANLFPTATRVFPYVPKISFAYYSCSRSSAFRDFDNKNYTMSIWTWNIEFWPQPQPQEFKTFFATYKVLIYFLK